MKISRFIPAAFILLLACAAFPARSEQNLPIEARNSIEVRGVYGGIPAEVERGEKKLSDYGINAIFLHSGSITVQLVELVKSQGARIFAEFNTMHMAKFLETHPDAAPVGTDGKRAPAPDGWQGICPTHPEYRRQRMAEFRRLLGEFDLDGIWLDYHHAHAAWERAEPLLPDTCFCPRCLELFQKETKIRLPELPAEQQGQHILDNHHQKWVSWRCGVFTDWVRQFRDIRDEVRPRALLGSYHNPWSDEDYDGARIKKLAIDLKAQAVYLDVLSPMPYHARFGHSNDPQWISRQVSWLGSTLGLQGRSGERPRIWPIVQLSDWGEAVPAAQVAEVLDHGTRRPATGVMFFAWGSLSKQPEKVQAMVKFYRALPTNQQSR